MFDVPYDWRLDINESSQKYLEKWIDYAKKQSGSNKVNIVAHSMGGLLARSYIQSDSYKNDVARLAMVGTPNHGAALAYYLWEGGDPDTADKITSESDSADQISGFISRHLHFYLLTANLLHYTLCGDQLVSFQFKSNLNMNKLSPVQEAKLVFTQKAARNAWHMIHNFVPSIRQLLPTYEGALSFSGNDMNILKCQNVFLTNLNFDTDISRMVPYQIEQSTYDNDKVITKIFVGTNNRTVQSINVNDPPESSDFYTPKKIHELCYAPPKELSSDLHSGYDMFYPDGIPDGNPVRSMNGDGTVLMDSVNIISENQSIAYNPNELKDAAHSGLIKAYANEIASFITQENDWDFRKRQKLTSESNISDADPMTALSIGIIGRAQPYIINSNSLGCGIHYQNLNREDDIPESSVEIQTDSGNIMIESPEAGMYTVFIRGIYEEDYYLFLTYHAENFTDTLTFHAFNQAETTHFTFNIDAKGLTINQAMDITLAVSSQAVGSDSKKTKLVWEVSKDTNVASYNIYAKKSGHPYYSKIANTQENFFLTEDQWAENDEIETIYYAVSAVDNKGNVSFLSPFVLNSNESSSEIHPVIIEPSVQNVRSDQGVVIFNVDNLSNLNWEAKTNTQWLSINSNSNLISVSYESNSAEARTGFITVTINENPVSTIILEINQDCSPVFYNSLLLKKNEWRNITSGNWYETGEGIKFDGISYRSYSKIQSKDVYNFEDSQLFVKWKSTSKSYARYYVGLFGVVSTHSFTTHHSYGSSIKIDTNNWYYTRIKITSDNSYEVSTCKEDYDINGGSVFNKASGELSENASMHLKQTYICFEQYDAYDSTNASMIIGEVKTNAIPVDIKSNKVVRYDFEDMTEVPSIFNHSGEWVIDNSGYNSSQSLYLFANESKSITIDATDIAYISFRVKFSAKSYYDSSGFNYGAPYIPLINQWSNKLTFAIPENATQLSWVYREDTKWSGQSTGSSLWIDDIEIGYFKTDSPLHFQPAWTGHPIDSMKIWLISDSFENLNLSTGDEIAVYDNNTCVGSTIIQSTDENNLNILTSRADDDDPGFIEGHNISFRVWDSSEQLEYSNIAGEFFDLSGKATGNLFKANADSAVKLFINTVEQTFQLKSGWNILSFNVMPELTDLSEIFKPLMDANSLVKVIDEKGQRLIFNAFSNQWENEIGEMSNEDGYLIKVNNDVEWTVEGEPVKNPFQVSLVSGWNIFGWPMKNPQEAMNVIQPLIDNNSLIKIIDEQGRRFIYNAFSEEWIDEIITFEPNKGYLIKLTQDALLTFDEIDLQTRKRVSTHRNVQSVDSVIFENFEGATVGKPSGITFAPSPNGQGAVFTRENESRVEYPFAMGLPRQGTIEFLINVHHGYHYSKYELTDNKTSAVIFDAGGQDVWWPGGMWFNVSDSGNVSLYTATAWAQGKGHNLNASDTGFKFNEWHAIGFSFGSQGQHIMVDGKIVASNEDYTETLEGCGNFDAPVNPLTLGELESCFWGKNQYDRGFDGIVDSFRASDKQMDWVIAKNETLPTDTHFQPVWSGHPIDSMKIWILQESFETLSLSPGDEIAIFDGDICVGSTIIESTSDQTLNILTSRKDDDDPGFEQGHKILFRTWDASEQIEFKNITGDFFLLSNTPTDNTFKPNADVAVSLYISTVERTFHLKSGWNIISFNIMPEQADLISIFQPLIDDELLVKIINEQGQRIIFNAFSNQWENEIGELSNDDGYLVKVAQDVDWIVEGEKLELPYPISLKQGWNIMAWPDENTQSAFSVVQPLIDDESLIKVIDEQGFRIIYNAFAKQWIDEIVDFNPGKGFLIKTAKESSLTIDHNQQLKRNKVQYDLTRNTTSNNTSHYKPVWDGYPYNSLKLWFVEIDGFVVENNDEIGIFDQGQCVGAATLQQPVSFDNILKITCSENDGSGNGFTSGNDIIVKLWDASEQIEITAISPQFMNMSNAEVIQPPPTFTGNNDFGVKLIIKNDNHAPVITAIDNQSMYQNDQLIIPVSAIDPDDDLISFTAKCNNDKINISMSGAELTLKPDQDWFGTGIVVTVLASDSKGLTDAMSFNLLVRENLQQVNIPTGIKGHLNQNVLIPVKLNNPDEIGIEGIDLTLSIDTTILEPVDATLTGGILENQGYSIHFNKENGMLVIYSESTPVNSSGDIVFINCHVCGELGQHSDLIISRSLINRLPVHSVSGSFNIVNSCPVFSVGEDVIANEDEAVSISNWANNISAGYEPDQNLSFIITADNNLFKQGPDISIDGTLSYIPKQDINGVANISVRLQDDGGTKSGGCDTSDIKNFSIEIIAVNDCPGFTKGKDLTVSSKAEKFIVPNWATDITAGPSDESEESLTFLLSADNPDMFDILELSSDGTLTYKPSDNAKGMAEISVQLKDEGECIDTQTFSININRSVLSGTINYYANDKLPVPNVQVLIQGEQAYSATTDQDGKYTFSAIPPGDYSIVLSKMDDKGGLSGTDATDIAGVAVEELTATCSELIASDIYQDGEILSTNASRVAKYAAGLRTCLTDDCIDWAFVQQNSCDSTNVNSFSISVNEDITDMNFKAIRYGDITGNWKPDNYQTKKRNRRQDTAIISVSQNASLSIPFVLNKSASIRGIDFSLLFDNSILQSKKVVLTNEMRHYQKEVNFNTDGKIVCVLYTIPQQIYTSGDKQILLNLDFDVIGQLNDKTNLSLTRLELNEGSVDGGFYIQGQTYQNIELIVKNDDKVMELADILYLIQCVSGQRQNIENISIKDIIDGLKMLSGFNSSVVK